MALVRLLVPTKGLKYGDEVPVTDEVADDLCANGQAVKCEPAPKAAKKAATSLDKD